MNLPKQKPDIKQINTSDMRVTDDGHTVLVGGRRFKRTVLPSVARPKHDKEVEEILEELEQEG